MKTIKEWLEELPEPYRTQALENSDIIHNNNKSDSLPSALDMAFNWPQTNQGWEYWHKLFSELVSSMPDPEDYWQERCKLAEAIIEASPCDPDITAEQIAAWHAYHSFLKERNEN